MSLALGELAARFGCELRGDPQVRIERVAALGAAGPGALSFLANPKLVGQLTSTAASAVVLDARSAAACPTAALIAANPHALFARIAAELYPSPPLRAGVHASAIVEPGARIDPSAQVDALSYVGAGAVIGPRCRIGPGCVVDAGAVLGADCELVARVTLVHGVQLGLRVLVHPGAVIGADGFGLARDGVRWLKVPQVGTVRIGDDVEIGANTTIDRGAIGDTLIAEGVKLDNQIQIAHNVQIGAHTAIAGCTGIAGSTRIGARCMIAGAVAVNGHITICDDVVITGMAMVTHSIREPGIYSSGMPLEPAPQWRRMVAKLRRLTLREPRGRSTPGTSSAAQQAQDAQQEQP